VKKFRGAFLKNDSEISIMAEAGEMVAEILDAIEDAVEVGVPTLHLEKIASDMCKKFKVKPAFLGYGGFPNVLCCSINEQVVHGFPSERILVEGDIVSCDMGVIHKDFYGDAARTFAVGKISEEAKKLMQVTEKALFVGIEIAQVGKDIRDIGIAVQDFVETHGFSVVRRFVGHGIGSKLHEKPEIPNFKAGMPIMPIQVGMVLAIEPMVTVGTYEIEIMPDKWTAVTKDRKLSAHFEHSIVITPSGAHILTKSKRDRQMLDIVIDKNKKDR